MGRHSVVVVDDDSSIRFAIRAYLQRHAYEVIEAGTCAEAGEILARVRPDAALLDYELPDGTALDLLPRLRDAEVPVVVLTANGTIDLAVRAIKEGADQFLTKPVELPALFDVLQRVIEHRRDRSKRVAVERRDARSAPDPFIGTSPAILQLREEAGRLAAADGPVLILGETGSGKGVLASWLHRNGPRADEAFVDLNCAGLSRELLESDLFGHERGAFTGASAQKRGLLEVAHRGSLFLDELGDVDLQVQPRLLKVLEEKRFRRIGDVQDRQVDVRLIAATHQDLSEAVREKRFRADLFFRISTLPLRIPPLRERAADIPALAERLLAGLSPARGHLELSPRAVAQLQEYRWPGNVRELRNVLERATILSRGGVLDVADLRFDAAAGTSGGGGEQDTSGLTLEQVEKLQIERVLRRENGKVVRAAEKLGVPKSSLYSKLKKHGIPLPKP
ncbi:MAG: sigma-54 dependent transcriptional regulator [Myxococcales bacterium]